MGIEKRNMALLGERDMFQKKAITSDTRDKIDRVHWFRSGTQTDGTFISGADRKRERSEKREAKRRLAEEQRLKKEEQRHMEQMLKDNPNFGIF